MKTDTIQIPHSTLVRARQLLEKTAAERTEYMEKLAKAEIEKSILMGVLEMINEGAIDPRDALEKVAEYKDSPEKWLLNKQAMEHWSQGYQLGQPDTVVEVSLTPEQRFVENLKHILNHE